MEGLTYNEHRGNIFLCNHQVFKCKLKNIFCFLIIVFIMIKITFKLNKIAHNTYILKTTN